MPRKLPDVTSGYEIHLDSLPAGPAGAVDWDRVFGAARPLRIEIGVGNSPFLIEVSRLCPDFNYLGFEYSAKRVLKFLKKVEKAEVTNIRILRMNAAVVLDRIFRPASVDHIFLNHPDPWPKRRHAKKRFVSPANASSMLRLLRPGGGISLRTDALDYALEMLQVLDGTEGLVNASGAGSFAAAPAYPFETPYEVKFRAAGREIRYLEYRTPAGRVHATSPGLMTAGPP
jgi:tRNA (guanine-N7-)-methyltransferase